MAAPGSMDAARLLSTLCACSLLACATAPRRLWAEDDTAALLLHGETFELRVREGRVEQVLPATYPGDRARVREVEDVDELRFIYAATGHELRVRGAAREIEVNGWVGLACVRAGQVCGAAPTEPPRVMVVLRFE